MADETPIQFTAPAQVTRVVDIPDLPRQLAELHFVREDLDAPGDVACVFRAMHEHGRWDIGIAPILYVAAEPEDARLMFDANLDSRYEGSAAEELGIAGMTTREAGMHLIQSGRLISAEERVRRAEEVLAEERKAEMATLLAERAASDAAEAAALASSALLEEQIRTASRDASTAVAASKDLEISDG